MTDPIDVTDPSVAQMRAWRELKAARDAYEAAFGKKGALFEVLDRLRAAEKAFKEADQAAKTAQDEAAARITPATIDQPDLFGSEP